QALWSQDEASYQGEFVRFDASWAWPKPVQQPRVPILVGAGGTEKTFTWIARSADGWLTTPGETDLDAKLLLLNEAWSAAGRTGPAAAPGRGAPPRPGPACARARDGRARRALRHPRPRRGRGRRPPPPPGRPPRPHPGPGHATPRVVHPGQRGHNRSMW